LANSPYALVDYIKFQAEFCHSKIPNFAWNNLNGKLNPLKLARFGTAKNFYSLAKFKTSPGIPKIN
jgi:hypothetical protein